MDHVISCIYELRKKRKLNNGIEVQDEILGGGAINEGIVMIEPPSFQM